MTDYISQTLIMQSTVSLVFLYNNQIIEDIPHTTITERDGHASTFAASRLLLTMFPNLDIRNTSLNEKKFDKPINWDSFRTQEQGPYLKQLKYLKNPHFYVWNHFFCQAPLWELGSDSYYIITLQTSDMELLSLRKKFIPLNEKNTIHRVILNEEYKNIEKTFVFLNVKDSEFCQVTSSKLYIDTIGLFNGLYRRKQEEWLVYTISKDEYPPTEILQKAQALIIPGSTSSAYDRKQWIDKLSIFLLDCYEQYKQLKMIGICFGFQLLCQIFGGHVEPTRLRKKNKYYNYLGNGYQVRLNEQTREVKCFQQMNLPESLQINRVHGDIVQQIPPNFINCGSSNIVRNEIVISRDERIFGMQCHPEYSSSLLSLYASYIKSQQEKIPFNRVLQDKDFQNFFKNKTDQQSLLMCLYFLKY